GLAGVPTTFAPAGPPSGGAAASGSAASLSGAGSSSSSTTAALTRVGGGGAGGAAGGRRVLRVAPQPEQVTSAAPGESSTGPRQRGQGDVGMAAGFRAWDGYVGSILSDVGPGRKEF